MTDSQCVSRGEFGALVERVDAFEEENEQLREENQELTEQVDQLQQRVDELEEQPTIEFDSEQQNPTESLTIDSVPVGRKISGAVSEYDFEAELEQLKFDLEASNPTPEGGKTTVQQHETPLEQVTAMPKHIADGQLTVNQERARFVAANISDYATKVGTGDYALTAGDLRTVLTAAFDQSHSETVNRVRTFLADLGGGEIEIRDPSTTAFKNTAEKKQKGKKLIVSASLVRRLEQIETDHDVVTGMTV